MKKAVVTGGAGFIGSNLAEELANMGYEVVILDNLSTGNINNLSNLLKKRHVISTLRKSLTLLKHYILQSQYIDMATSSHIFLSVSRTSFHPLHAHFTLFLHLFPLLVMFTNASA